MRTQSPTVLRRISYQAYQICYDFRRVWLILAVLLPSLLAPATAGAVTTLSQGYLTKENIAAGSIVSLVNNSSDEVTAATTANVNNILGVELDGGNSLIALSNGQANQIQVATNGVAQVLVSDINGNISTGDQITASPIAGVGMKATSNVKVIGVAQGNLSSNNPQTQTYKDKTGTHSVKIAQIPVLVSVSFYYKQPDKTVIPQAIQNVANALAGKQVNATPILISAAIFILTLVVVVSIIYSMIHSSIISVGRNPMSQGAIYRDLIQMSALVLVILAVAFGAIYMILAKF